MFSQTECSHPGYEPEPSKAAHKRAEVLKDSFNRFKEIKRGNTTRSTDESTSED